MVIVCHKVELHGTFQNFKRLRKRSSNPKTIRLSWIIRLWRDSFKQSSQGHKNDGSFAKIQTQLEDNIKEV